MRGHNNDYNQSFEDRGGQRGGHKGQGQRARPPPMSKRRMFPWINGRIIAASESGNIQEVLGIIAEHLPQMNLVNLSTAIHRIAKLTADNRKVQIELCHDRVVSELLEMVARTLARVHAQDAQPQSLSNIVWSLATIRHVDMDLSHTLAALSVANMSAFKPFELSTMLWAFAKLGTVDAAMWSMPVFHAAPPHIVTSIDQFGFRCLSTTVWAFATARQHNNHLFRAISNQMLPMVHMANCQEMANTAWAFGTLGFHSDDLFDKIAEHAPYRLDEFKPQELSNMLWGFATNGFFHSFFYASASILAQRMDLQAQHLANILWAFARVQPRHSITNYSFLALLPGCTTQLETFKPQEVSSTVLAVAKVFGQVGADESGRPKSAPESSSYSQNSIMPALPSEVLQFLQAVMPWTVAHIHEFSAHSIANTLQALNMIPGFADEAFFHAIRHEVLARYHTVDPAVLLQLLKAFVGGQRERSMDVIQCICERLAQTLSTLRMQEVQILSRLYANMTGHHLSQENNRVELREALLQFAGDHRQEPSMGYARALTDGKGHRGHVDNQPKGRRIRNVPVPATRNAPAQLRTIDEATVRLSMPAPQALKASLTLPVQKLRAFTGAPNYTPEIGDIDPGNEFTPHMPADYCTGNDLAAAVVIGFPAQFAGNRSGSMTCPSRLQAGQDMHIEQDLDVWRWSVKNSFLHLESHTFGHINSSDEESNENEGKRSNSSHRSSSLPSRFDHEDTLADWQRWHQEYPTTLGTAQVVCSLDRSTYGSAAVANPTTLQ